MCVSAGIPPRETRFLRARFALRLLSSTYFTHSTAAPGPPSSPPSPPASLGGTKPFEAQWKRSKALPVRPYSGSPACQSAAGGPVPATVACAMSGNFEVTWAIKGSILRGTRESEPNCLFQNERIFPLCFQAEWDRGERGRRRLERPAFAVCSLDGAAGNVDKKCSLLSEGGRADFGSVGAGNNRRTDGRRIIDLAWAIGPTKTGEEGSKNSLSTQL